MTNIFKKNIQRQIRIPFYKPSFPKIFYWLILINVTLDIFSFWSEPGGITAILRVVILYAVFFYFLLLKKLKFEKNLYIVIFSTYALLQLFIAVDFEYSFKISLQIITSLLMFFVGYALIKNEFDFYYYLKQFFWIYAAIIVNTIVSNIFKIGIDDYTQSTDYVVGGLNDLWNIYTYALIMLPLLLRYKIKTKIVLYVASMSVLIFLIISLKRIVMIEIIFASGLFIFFLGLSIEAVKKIVLVVVVLGISFPIYSEVFLNRINVRAEKGRFDRDFYESEGRYQEIIYVKEMFSNFNEPLNVFLGLRAFDSRGVVGGGTRNFHVDYALISFTLGFVGLFLYLLIYSKLYFQIISFNKILRSNSYMWYRFKTHLITSIVLVSTSLISAFGGHIFHVTFRMMIFLSVGAIFKLLYLEIKRYQRIKYASTGSL